MKRQCVDVSVHAAQVDIALPAKFQRAVGSGERGNVVLTGLVGLHVVLSAVT
jgi:hypothetical protein